MMQGSPSGTFQMPPALSTIASEVDRVYYILFWSSVAAFIAIVGATAYFVYKYRASNGAKAEPTKGHHTLELFWTFTPLIFLAFLFHEGFLSYVRGAVAPASAIEVRVRGKKWNWEFEYPTGSREAGALTVPAGVPIKLIMSSQDVIHSFFIPAFRVKKDVVPGMYSSLWFEALPVPEGQDGYDVQVFCTEYCGKDHSAMLATIHVVTQERYDQFLRDIDRPPEGKTPEQWGEQLFVQNGCPSCHSVDGTTRSQGPNLRGKFGTEEHFEDGTTAMIDESYVRESILRPQARIVQGYSNVQMSSFVLNDARLDALVAYVRSLR